MRITDSMKASNGLLNFFTINNNKQLLLMKTISIL